MNSSHELSLWLRRIGLAAASVIVVAIGGWYVFFHGKSAGLSDNALAAEEKSPGTIAVEVVQPQSGGIQRICTQPGTVEPFESADLYAKVSGFLVEQNVDIGSHVKKGDILARIYDPECEKQVQHDRAKKLDANAKVKQMNAYLAGARAEAKAADAAVTLAKVLVRAKTAYRQYREKYSKRIKELVKKEALEARVADEQEDNYIAALEAENAAKEAVNAAEEKATAAHARIDQVDADLEEAKDNVDVAMADLERSQVLLKYTLIESPYTGVVTRRTFHVGDFIKSADQGGLTPLLSVERTDLMRVVIQLPDRDVPYVTKGAPAIVEIDALPGVVYETHGSESVAVSRWSDAEDPATRTMRTEVDVKNTDGKLRHGMYGRATLILGAGTPNALRVPSAALVGKADNGRGSVRIVRDGKAHIVNVRYAADNGVETEIVGGLSPTDQVIVRAAGAIEEDTPVAVGNH